MKRLAVAAIVLASTLADAQSGRMFRPLLNPVLLRYEGVRRELGLTAKQNETLLAIWNEMRRIDAEREKWSGGNVSRLDRPKLDAMAQRNNRRSDQIKTLEASTIGKLGAKQKTRLKQLSIQLGRATIALHPEVRVVIGTTELQAKKIDELQRKELERSRKLRGLESKAEEDDHTKKWIEASYNVLTSAQRQKLESMMGRRVDPKKLLTDFYLYVAGRQ